MGTTDEDIIESISLELAKGSLSNKKHPDTQEYAKTIKTIEVDDTIIDEDDSQ